MPLVMQTTPGEGGSHGRRRFCGSTNVGGYRPAGDLARHRNSINYADNLRLVQQHDERFIATQEFPLS
jgi:hypothetical protein